MNMFFINKVKKLIGSIPALVTDPLARLRESMKNRECTFEMKLVTEEDVHKIITSLNNSSATGVDFIDTKTVKLVKDEIVGALTTIINLSIQQATFPEIYKHTKVIPSKKNQSLCDIECASYRPVNLLPIPGKIVEKAICNQLVEYLETKKK